jgi:hypothetical protein
MSRLCMLTRSLLRLSGKVDNSFGSLISVILILYLPCRIVTPRWNGAQWHPTLPLELQYRIIQTLLYTDASQPFDYVTAASLCLVNRAWNSEAVKFLYRKIIVRQQSHFTSLFAHQGPMHLNGPGQQTKHLQLLVPPTSYHSFCVHRVPIERVDFDFGSSRIFFDTKDSATGLPLSQAGRTSGRIATLATCSVPLYQLTLSLTATTMRLFISSDNPLTKDDIWQDLLAGHIAALRMMKHLDHLILDAELYLVLLPGYFQTWCDNEQWQGVLAALKDEAGVNNIATFFDETALTKVGVRLYRVRDLRLIYVYS